MQFEDANLVEVRSRPNCTVIPLSVRYYQIVFFLGLFLIPCFAAGPFFLESFSYIFTVAFSVVAALFLCLCLWTSRSYWKDPDKYGLLIDEHGIRERRLLARERIWNWHEIESIEMVAIGEGHATGLLLFEKTWPRRWRIANYDATFANIYVVSQSDLLAQLRDCQHTYQNAI